MIAHFLHRRSTPPRGMAALTVVMILFFVMALVAAYTNRNLIFEQRTSANLYRAARSINATDAGVDWAVAMLNGGRIDGNCQPTQDPNQTDFRRRYLVDSTNLVNGEGGYELQAVSRYPACINNNGALSCICPSAAEPAPAMAVPADGAGSAFRIAFVLPGRAIRPGAMEFLSRGCASPGAGNSACYAQGRVPPEVDALTGALTTVGLVRALPVPPIAALTTGADVDVTAGTLTVVNGDAGTGFTAHAGGAIQPMANVTATGPAGSMGDGLNAGDNQLSTLAAAANDAWFRALHGMDAANFRRQPAAVRQDCPPLLPCTRLSLAPLVAGYPRNLLWFNGDLVIDGAGDLGTAADPLFLVVTGTLTISANARITGYIHANDVVWTAAGNGASVQGAMVARNRFVTSGAAVVSYDRQVLDLIRLRYGSFVRVPGSWNLTDPANVL